MKKFSSFNKESSDSKENAELFEQFIEKYGSVENNAEKSKQSVKLFEDVFTELDNLVKKEELSELFLSQLNAANKQFAEFKKNVNKLVDEKNQDISQTVYSIVNKANSVLEKVDTESKSYNKRYYSDLEKTEEKFNDIYEKLDTVELQTIQEKIDQFKENLLELKEVVDTTLPQQNKKVEKFIIENEEAVKNVNNTSERLQLAVTEILKDFETKLESLSETFLTSDSLDSTNKKYNKKIVEVHNQFEKIRKDFTKVDNHYTLSKDQFKDIGDKLNSLTENIFAVEQRIKGERDKQNYKIVEADTKLDKKIEDVKADVDNVTSDVSNLKETVISNLGKVENNLSEIVSKDIKDAKDQLEERISKVKLEQHKVDTKLKKTFNEEFKSVKKDIRSADTKINNQLNKYKLLEEKTKSIITDVKNVFKDKKFVDLNKKITFIEETLEKFNEKTVLTEELVNNPAETNKDPLTPLNQNFVTFDQLKKHYQLFINRVQQQLMSVGGGGAVRVDQLDDVDHNSVLNAQNGQALVFITKASGGNNKFEVRTVATSGGIANVDANVSTVGGADGDITNAQILSFVTRAVSANGGNLSLSGNIIPDADNVHSLGTSSLRFKDLFLSGNTFSLGGLTLKDTGGALAVTATESGQTILDASPSTPSLSSADLTIANVAGYAANLDSKLTTANVSELTNLYYTDTRSRGAISTAAGSRNYNSSTGVITIPSTSDDVSEGSNKFFTDIRARNALAANIDSRLTIANVAGYAANLDSRFTGANIGGALTGGTDIEVTAGGTINYTGSGGGGGSGVSSIGGATGAVGNVILGRMVNDSGALTISNIAGYHANLESELTTANVGELTNLYFTDTRAKDALAANIDTRLTIANVAGYHANLESELTTANVSEVTNLYFTDARANDALVANINYANVDYMSNLVGSATQIQLTSEKNFIRFYAANQSAFPDASTYHGAIMHSHADAAMYFAHGGAWVKIIDTVSLASNINSRLTIANVSGYHANLESELTTANVGELTNLYFTDGRARSAISTAAGARAYDSGTGVITIPSTSDDVSEGSTNLFYSNAKVAANVQHSLVRSLTLAASDETTDLTTGTAKVTFRAPFPMTLPATPLPRASLQTAASGTDLLTVDINEGGTSILSTKLTFNSGETTTKTATTPCVLSDTSIADDAIITVDIDQIGDSAAGKGLKITLYYTVTE